MSYNSNINIWNNEQIISELDVFLELYTKRPISNNHGGGLSVNLLYLYFVLKKFSPQYIIESGVFKGLGTWLIDQILPNAKILCIDPYLSQLVYKSKNAEYTTKDFLNITNKDISKEIAEKTLIIFDDHQDQFVRLNHANDLGFKNIFLDDNYPEFCGKRHISIEACLSNATRDGYILPANSREKLLSIIDTYYTFPPIFSYNEPVSMEKSYINANPLLFRIENKYSTYANDMHNYRWSTYIKIKN